MNCVRSRAFVYAWLAAFVGQSIVTTSHFHANAGTDGASVASIDGPASVAAQAGLDKGAKHKSDHNAKCPICQAASVTGSFVAATQSVFLPLFDTFFVSHDERIIAVERFMASWRSRAPPAL
jgi:hypothetical protein